MKGYHLAAVLVLVACCRALVTGTLVSRPRDTPPPNLVVVETPPRPRPMVMASPLIPVLRPSPACLTHATRASVSLLVVEHGCFNFDEHRVELRWDARDARKNSRRVSAKAARALAAKIVDIADALERKPTCSSTSTIGTTLKWQCDDAAEQELEFEADYCSGMREWASTHDPNYVPTAPRRAEMMLQLARPRPLK